MKGQFEQYVGKFKNLEKEHEELRAKCMELNKENTILKENAKPVQKPVMTDSNILDQSAISTNS